MTNPPVNSETQQREAAFDEAKLKRELRALSAAHRLAFAASCSERLFPGFCVFSEREDFGDPALLRHSLDTAWQMLYGEELPREEVENLIESCRSAIPDSDDHPTFLGSIGQRATLATLYTLECSLSGDVQRATWAGRCVVGAIGAYLGGLRLRQIGSHTVTAAMEQQVKQDPLMRNEVGKQVQDLRVLQASAQLEPDLLEQLRHSSTAAGVKLARLMRIHSS
jgi:hypothetical protein